MYSENYQYTNQYAGYHRDGLLDIFIGLGVVFAALFLWADMPWMVAILAPLFLPVWRSAREKFLGNRVQDEELKGGRGRNSSKAVLVLAVFLGVALLAGIFLMLTNPSLSDSTRARIGRSIMLLMALGVSGIWLVAAFLLKLPRFAIYGLLYAVLFAGIFLFDFPLWTALGFAAGGNILGGSYVLASFLQKHPPLPAE